MAWYYNGSRIESYADIDKLVCDVIQHEDFNAFNFGETFSTTHKVQWMDKHHVSNASNISDNSEDSDLLFKSEDGWISGHISIPLPCDGVCFNSEEDTH